MTTPLMLTDVQDLVTSTLPDFGKPTFRQIAQQSQRYEIFSRWFRENKVEIGGGLGVRRQLMTSHDTDNLHTGPYSQDQVSFGDVMAQLRVDYVHVKKGWTFNYYELKVNQGPAVVFNVLEPKRSSALLNIASDIENKGWAAPSSSSDTTLPYGVTFWVTKNATTGFTGGYPSGFTSLAGIDLTTHPNFKNYSDTYVTANNDDLCEKMRQASLMTFFESPLGVGGDGQSITDSFRVYCNTETYRKFDAVKRNQNDDLGNDIGTDIGGRAIFNGNPIVRVPKLDEDTSDPVYMINHNAFKVMIMEGDFLRESPVKEVGDNHNQYVVWIDMSYNYLCEDRRAQSVLYKA